MTSEVLASRLAAAVDDARGGPAGMVTEVYPALASIDPRLLAAAVVRSDGAASTAGVADSAFVLMSVAKPFVLALAVDALGAEHVLSLTGTAPTGLAFNDPEAIRRSPDGRTNPMVNPGALSVSSLLTPEAIGDGLAAFAGRILTADDAMVDAIRSTNQRNRLLAELLDARGLLAGPVEDALHRYTFQSCLTVTVADLARMGAVLARGGTDPVTGSGVVSPEAAAVALDAMAVAGLYEASEAWMTRVGLPAKSGIAGGLVMVAPGVGALAAYSPGLDGAGNPARALSVASSIASTLTARLA